MTLSKSSMARQSEFSIYKDITCVKILDNTLNFARTLFATDRLAFDAEAPCMYVHFVKCLLFLVSKRNNDTFCQKILLINIKQLLISIFLKYLTNTCCHRVEKDEKEKSEDKTEDMSEEKPSEPENINEDKVESAEEKPKDSKESDIIATENMDLDDK